MRIPLLTGLSALALAALVGFGPSSLGTAAAAPGGPATGGIAVIGDFGAGTDPEAQVAGLVARARPVAVVTVGDNVYTDGGYQALVGNYYGPWIASRTFWPAAGNHDYAEGIDAFDAYFGYLGGHRYYSVSRKGIQFLVLDSTAALDSRREMARQRQWLQAQLRSSSAAWQVVVLHHPPYSSGSVHGSTTQLRWPFWAWGADLVLAGHEHQYERLQVGRTAYVVDGAGGKDLYPFGTPLPGSRSRFDAGYGALFLSATPRQLTGEFWTSGGRLVDRFAIHQP
jgi:tartrate-resistant acid phosphatase type 5